jgi:hypothetical protein
VWIYSRHSGPSRCNQCHPHPVEVPPTSTCVSVPGPDRTGGEGDGSFCRNRPGTVLPDLMALPPFGIGQTWPPHCDEQWRGAVCGMVTPFPASGNELGQNPVEFAPPLSPCVTVPAPDLTGDGGRFVLGIMAVWGEVGRSVVALAGYVDVALQCQVRNGPSRKCIDRSLYNEVQYNTYVLIVT